LPDNSFELNLFRKFGFFNVFFIVFVLVEY
jgi:hypothetical protein